GTERQSFPAPAKPGGAQARYGLLAGETRFVRRGVEIAANDPAQAAEFAVGVIHRLHVRHELLHRFLANPDVFTNLAAVALEMHRVNEEKLPWPQLVGGESETARRHDRARRLPHFRPGAERLQPA